MNSSQQKNNDVTMIVDSARIPSKVNSYSYRCREIEKYKMQAIDCMRKGMKTFQKMWLRLFQIGFKCDLMNIVAAMSSFLHFSRLSSNYMK